MTLSLEPAGLSPDSTKLDRTVINGITVVVISLLAVFFSLRLVQAELDVLNDPNAVLSCDINPLIACSDSLLEPEAHLFFGIPNAVLGAMAFSVLAALGVILVLSGSLPRLIWIGLAAGATGGLVTVAYFLYLSVYQFGKLCPYCLGVWAVTLAFLPIAYGGAAGSGALGRTLIKPGKTIYRYWPAITVAFYLLVILFIVVTMRDTISFVLA